MEEEMKRIPAFPEQCDGGYDHDGMDLRDWFAGQAISGFLQDTLVDNYTQEEIAKLVYSVADAMMAERKRGG